MTFRRHSSVGFSLVEILVATAVFLLLIVLSVNVVDKVRGIWRQTSDTIGEWQSARNAFESLTRRLSLATLDTGWAYFNSAGNLTATDPTKYGRHSQLQFVAGPATNLLPSVTNLTSQAIFFQSPLGRTRDVDLKGFSNLLNACGYYVQFNDDSAFRPDTGIFQNVSSKSRFRLMELVEPSENLGIYDSVGATDLDWFRTPVSNKIARPLAENVIGIFILPLISSLDGANPALLSPDYSYNSRVSHPFAEGDIKGNTLHQLPPLVQVTLIAISEKSAIRLEQENGGQMPTDLFTDAPFNNPLNYAQDIQTVEARLIEKRLSYRIFSSVIALRGAKWSPDLP